MRGRAGARADRRAALPGALQCAVRKVRRALRGGVHWPGALHAGGPPAVQPPAPRDMPEFFRTLAFYAWTGCLLGVPARMHDAPAPRTSARSSQSRGGFPSIAALAAQAPHRCFLPP